MQRTILALLVWTLVAFAAQPAPHGNANTAKTDVLGLTSDAIVEHVVGVSGGVAVQPVVVAQEGNGKVTLRYDLPLGEPGQLAQRVDEIPAISDGPFIDWNQTAEVISGTGAVEIFGTNPTGDQGLVRRTGNCTIGRLSWNGNQYAWRIPTSGGTVEYYRINLTGYQSCTDVDVYAIVCSKGTHASAQISINSSSGTTNTLGPSWEIWSITKPSSAMNWNSSSNVAKVNMWNGTDTLGCGSIVVYINGAVPVSPAPGPFNLTSPANGAADQATSGILRWGTSSNADEYEVYLDEYDPPGLIDYTSETHYDYGLAPGTTYYWDIRATNGAGATWSSNGPRHFTTMAYPGAFDLVSPANGATGQPSTGTLSWGSSSGATNYDVYFGTSNPPPLLRNVTGTSTSYSGNPGQTYYWYVVAKNAAGSRECNNTFHFSTISGVPGQFDLSSPTNNASHQPVSGSLSWGVSSGATSYVVYWGTSNPPDSLRTVTGTSTYYSGSLGDTCYWYVVAKNAEGYRECNNRFRFSIGGQSSSEDTLHVDLEAFNNAVGLTAGGTFFTAARLTADTSCTVSAVIFYRWNAINDDYMFVWAGNTSTQPGAVIESIPFTNADSAWNRVELLTPVALAAGEDIWVGPRMNHAAGTYPLGTDDGPYVATRGDWINYQGTWEELGLLGLSYNWHIRALVRYGATEIAEDTGSLPIGELALSCDVHPNPFGRSTTISYSLPTPGEVKLDVVDATGRTVTTFVNGRQEPGEYSVTWDVGHVPTSQLPKGVYFCRLRAGNQVAVRKMVRTQ